MKSKKKKQTQKRDGLSSSVSHILLVEDNPDDIRLIQWIISGIRNSQFKLECVNQLKKALKRLGKGGIDVILLDLGLPDSQGIDTLRSVYNKAPKVPIVVLTCLGDEKVSVQAIKEGAQDYLLKGQVDSNLLKRTLMYAIERKQAEEALRESEERFRTLVEKSVEAIFLVNFNMEFVFWNPAAEKMMGLSTIPTKKFILSDVLTPDSLKIAVANVAKAALTGTTRGKPYELTVRRIDGTLIDIEVFIGLIKYKGKTHMLGTARDITERKKAEKFLKESQEKIKNILESSPDAISVTDLNGNITECNEQMLKMHGFSSKEEVIGKSAFMFIAEKDHKRAIDNLKKTLKCGSIKNIEYTLLTKDGKEFLGEVSASVIKDTSGKPVAFVAVSKDITERKQAYEKLHYQADLLENVSDAIISTDIDFNIRSWNRAAETMYGWSAYEVMGKSMQKVTSLEFPYDKEPDVFKKILKKGHWKSEVIQKHREGTIINVLASFSLLKDDSGNPVGMVVVNRDITERKQVNARYTEQLKSFIKLGNQMRMELRREALLQNICNTIIETQGWRQVILSLRDYNVGTAQPVAMAGYDEKTKKKTMSKPPVLIKTAEKFLREEFKISRSYYIDHTHWKEMQKYPADLVITSVKDLKPEGWHEKDILLIPIQGKEKVLGFISPDNPVDGKRPTKERIQALEIFADMTAVAIENARLYEQAQYEIAERKRTEEELRETRDYLENMINSANAAIIVWNPQFRIIRFNYASEHLTGYTAHEIVGKELKIIFPEASRDEVLSKIECTLKGEYWKSVEIPILRKNGDIRIVLWNSANIYADDGVTIIATIAQGIDVTDRKRAEKALRQSEERFRAIFETAQDSIFIKDHTLRYIQVNSGMERLFGLPRSKLIGKTDEELFGKKTAIKIRETDSRVLKGEIIEEESAKPVKGITMIFHVIKVPMRDSSGKIIGLCGIARDVTDRKRAEEQIKQSLKEKEVLLKEIHHRVKNNMQIISSLLNLQSRYIKGKKALEMFQNSQARIRAMALVHEKLYRSQDLARINFVEYVNDLVKQLFRSHGISPAKIKFNIKIKDVFLDINTAIPCSLIINELVSNSLKHAFPASAKAAAGKPNGRKGKIDIVFNLGEDNKLLLMVKDNGIGLPDKIDIKNTTTLGLQLVTTLVEQLGGTIEVDMKRGTTFKIKFDKSEGK
ncbi:PAS domain S-box protein [candidate division WOR-3 bacterium]|nr:PAS domain S-box protein [candidate division WOR-3 bacterium]